MYPPPKTHTRHFRKLTAACAALLLGLTLSTPALAQVPAILGDLDDDGFVGIQDLNIILGNWNQYVTPGDLSAGDAHHNPAKPGFIGIADLNVVLANWNAGYPTRQPFKGMNLHESRYWAREWIFVDIMKRAREWTLSNTSTATDSNGWPILEVNDTASTILVDQIPGFPTGTYICTYDGAGGSLAFTGNVQNVQASTGQVTFDVAGTEISISLVVTGSNPNDPIKNIKIWMPGFDETSPSTFHPLFVKRLRPFKVIRFMDWQHTNNVDEVPWAQRTTPSYFSQSTKTRRGISLEHMVELCNELGADPWFCMPHKADDTYVTNFATYVRDNLHLNAKIYVEWSNEVWNAKFPVYDWIRQGAIPGPGNNVELGASEFFDMWANNAADDFSLWHTVFAGNEDRIIRVFASTKDSDNAWVAGKVTDRLKAKSFDKQFDVISTSAYFGDDDYSGPTTDGLALINYAMSDNNPVGTIKDSEDRYIEHGFLAQQLSVEMGRTIGYLAYEAGQHMTPKDGNNNFKPYAQAVKNAQVLPQMYEAYFKNIKAFEDAGGSLYVAFNYINNQSSDDGAWGHT